jgi:hypothetical protein
MCDRNGYSWRHNKIERETHLKNAPYRFPLPTVISYTIVAGSLILPPTDFWDSLELTLELSHRCKHMGMAVRPLFRRWGLHISVSRIQTTHSILGITTLACSLSAYRQAYRN